jgi:hypothetical protein
VWAVVGYPPGDDLTVEAMPVFVGYQYLHLTSASWLVRTTTLIEDVTHTDFHSASPKCHIFA